MADVYATIAFYLNHQEDVEQYLRHRQQQAQAVRDRNAARPNPLGIRDRIQAKNNDQRAHPPSPQLTPPKSGHCRLMHL
ncbi:MAG: hypothetical protein AAFV72_20910 [Cyanobacteria bacterium J06635_1]